MPRRAGRKRKYSAAQQRKLIEDVELTKKRFGLKTDKEAVEKIVEDRLKQAPGTRLIKAAEIRRTLPRLSKARTRHARNTE